MVVGLRMKSQAGMGMDLRTNCTIFPRKLEPVFGQPAIVNLVSERGTAMGGMIPPINRPIIANRSCPVGNTFTSACSAIRHHANSLRKDTCR